MRKIIIGSRRSKLALTQTNWVADQLKKLGVPFEFEVKEIVTKGDRILDVTLSKVVERDFLSRKSNKHY